MAIFRIVTFLIHAIVLAFASLLVAVFTHLVPALLAFTALIAAVVLACSCAGVGGIAFVRRRRKGH